MQRYYRSLVSAHRVLTRFRHNVDSTCSPVHFILGLFDLAVTRFTGRATPAHPGALPHRPGAAVDEASTHQVSSYGYWPGGADEGVFYAHVHPPPPGLHEHPLRSLGPYFDAAPGRVACCPTPTYAARSTRTPTSWTS